MGIHNEAGVEKVKLPSSKELVARMLKMITDTKDPERGFVPFQHDGKDEVVLLVNNLGGMSELELSSIANDAVLDLEKQNIIVKRIIVGSVMTSLNLPGFSLTTLLLPREGKISSKRVLDLLDAKAYAPGWKFMVNGPPGIPEAAGQAAEPQPIKSGGNVVARRHTFLLVYKCHG
jgi:dihydroxyacetone kinase